MSFFGLDNPLIKNELPYLCVQLLTFRGGQTYSAHMFTYRVIPMTAATSTTLLSRVGQVLASPLQPARYLETFNPLWSDHARGKVTRIQRETDDAVSVFIAPNRAFPAARPGQYISVGVDIEGVRHWRSYSLTEVPDGPGSELAITVRAIDGGQVSTYINRQLGAGALVHLKPAAGEFTLPAASSSLLFITAGSGITPAMGMLRQAARQSLGHDIVHLHFTPDHARCLFREELPGLRGAQRRIVLSLTREAAQDGEEQGHFSAELLDRVCPDWRERQAYVCGPQALNDAVMAHWADAGLELQLRQEAFLAVRKAATGAGGVVYFEGAGKEAKADGETSLLEVAEAAGLSPRHGCRMGICCGCLATLKEGQVQDLTSGEIHNEPGDKVRICVCAAAGDVTLEL